MTTVQGVTGTTKADSVFNDLKNLNVKADKNHTDNGNIFVSAENRNAYLEAAQSNDPAKKRAFIRSIIASDLTSDGKIDGIIDGNNIFNSINPKNTDELLTQMTQAAEIKSSDDITDSQVQELYTPGSYRRRYNEDDLRNLNSSMSNENYRNSRFPGIKGSSPTSVANLKTPKFSGDLEKLINDTVALFDDKIQALVNKGVLKDKQEFINLIKAMIQQESGGRQSAVSPKKCRGLMQLLPDTAKMLGVNMNDPADNVKGGVAYIIQHLERFGNIPQALAAYNAGPGNVSKNLKRGGDGVPDNGETKQYVKNITAMTSRLNNQTGVC